MFFSTEGNLDIAHRVELSSTVFPPLSTYQLDRGRLENMLSDVLSEQGAVFLGGSKVQQIDLQPQSDTHSLRVSHEGNEEEISAR